MLAGEVEVDGEVVTRLGTKIDPVTAVVRVSGKRLPPISPNVYLVLNKPRGVVSTMSDPEGRAYPPGPRRRPARAALPRRPARHRHLGADPAHQRRRLRAADGAPVVRGGQDLRRRGRGQRDPGDAAAAARRGDARRRAGHRLRGQGADLRRGQGEGPHHRRAGDPRGSQPDRAAAARRRRTPGAPADPHPDRPGRAARASRPASCATSPSTSSACCWTPPSCDREPPLPLAPWQCERCGALPSSTSTSASTSSAGSRRWSST